MRRKKAHRVIHKQIFIARCECFYLRLANAKIIRIKHEIIHAKLRLWHKIFVNLIGENLAKFCIYRLPHDRAGVKWRVDFLDFVGANRVTQSISGGI